MTASSQDVARPLQQTDTWTFSSALDLLKSFPEHVASDALDEFLTQNKDVLLSPVPFLEPKNDQQSSKKILDSSMKEFTLRGISFTGVTSKSVAAAQRLSSILSISNLEALRIVLLTDKRSPEPAAGDKGAARLLFGGPAATLASNSVSMLEEADRIYLYVKAALKERRTVLRLMAECFNVRNVESTSPVVSKLGKSPVGSPDYLLDSVTELGTLIDLLLNSASVTGTDDDALETLVRDELFSHTNQLLQLVFDVLLALADIPVQFASSWFSLMQKISFGLRLGPYISSKDVFSVIHGLSTLISLQVFDLPSMDPVHLSDAKVFMEINEIILTQSPNNILGYAWLIRLYRKSILLEELPSQNESFLSLVPLKSTQSDITRLQNRLQSAPVFSEIAQLNKVLGFDNVFSVILTDMILAAVPLIHATDDILLSISEVLKTAPNASIERFFANEDARQLLVLARAKFPVSSSPYLRLASMNGIFALRELESLSSYMSVFEESKIGRLYDIDSENTDLVRLTQPVEVFPPFENTGKLALLLDVGTKAKIIPTASPDKVLVTFLHQYNGWAFLGRVLENISNSFESSEAGKSDTLESILDVLSRTAADDPANVAIALEYMSTFTTDKDIVDVIFRIFEQSLHMRSVVLSERILHLLYDLMFVIPTRIWPYLSTSSLLPRKGKEGFSSILFGSIETVQGDYSFTSALVKFVFRLAENCLSVPDDYPWEAKAEILAKFMQHLIHVFENYGNCKFNDSFSKFQLGVLIMDVFMHTLDTTYSVGSHLEVGKNPTKVFAKASQNIIGAFLTNESNLSRAASSIMDLIDILASPVVSHDTRDVSGFLGDVWIQSVFSFARLLVGVRSSVNLPASKLEVILFSKLPQLVTIYSQGGSLRKVILGLLTALTSGTWEASEMPSILSHLGQDYSRILLHSLARDLETSFDDYSVKISIYDFLCAIMEANQQGLAVLFVSGRNVFGEVSKTDDIKAEPKSVSLLSIMKKNIKDVEVYPPSVTVHLLDAISLALNSWTTAKSDKDDLSFVKVLSSMVLKFNKPQPSDSATDMIIASYDCKVFSKVAEILSLVLFTTKDEKCLRMLQETLSDKSFIEKLPVLLSFQTSKQSDQQMLVTSFKSVSNDYELSNFLVTNKKRNRFGPNMVYDLLLLDSLFEKSPNWADAREQVVSLSARIQFNTTQSSLTKSLGALITTFCRRLSKSVPRDYSKFVCQLLAVREPKDDHTISLIRELQRERVELAFLLLFTLNSADSGQKSLISFSIPIIEACNELMESPDMGFLNSNIEDSSYRSLLRIVYIAVSNLKSDFDAVNTRTQALLKLFDFVIAKGTTSIIIELQNDVYLAHTKKDHKLNNLRGRLDDLRLILSILKVFFQLDVISSLQTAFAASLKNHKTVDTLLSLYSFSHLILVNNEPIFAQLSLMYLQQFLLVESFANSTTDSKLFVVIRESMISQALRNGGVTISTAPQLHGTWSNGILPIIVSCLSRGKATNECAYTLGAFSKQVGFCIEAWSNDSSTLQISSAGTFETMQILYIFKFLNSIATAQGLTAKSSTDVDMPVLPGLETPQKRQEFVGYIRNLLKHPKFLKSRAYPSSLEEEAIIRAKGSEYNKFIQGLIEDISESKDILA